MEGFKENEGNNFVKSQITLKERVLSYEYIKSIHNLYSL